MVVIAGSSVAGRLELRESNAYSLLIGRCGYYQRPAWDLVQLRAQLGQWRKCLTLLMVMSGLIPRSVGRIQLRQVSGEQFSIFDSDLERRVRSSGGL